MRLCSRREILVGMGAAGLSPLIVSIGCTSEGGSSQPQLPVLPVYEWNGPLGPQNLFEHGVASGDPLPEGVIVWTRITSETAPAEPPESDDPLSVWWEVALDEAFERRVKQGTVRANPDSDFTVKVDVSELVWGRNYYYRFFAQGRQSSVGRTRLAPSGEQASQLRFGVCVGSSYGRGYFHGFRHMAGRADLDAVLHLGDYFYEYGNNDLPTPFIRPVEPDHETVTLEDYRIRYSQQRRDPDFQGCHRQHPFVVVWDDHESADNSWMGGAKNHDVETEGPWEDRIAAARQAFFEWIPIRNNPGNQLYRTFKYGDLADIIMLDTRIEGREEQFPVAVFSPDEPSLPKNIISAEQESWLQDQLTSPAKWKIIGNQVAISIWQLAPGTYFNADQWNGYPEGRDRVLGFLRDNDISNVVFVSGDYHTSWAMDVTVGDGSYSPETQEGAVAVEFVTPAISTPPGSTVAVQNAVASSTPHVRYAETTRNGYLVLDVQADKVQADWYLLDGVEQDQGNESLDASWAVLDGNKHVVERSAPETPIEEPPPLAG
jgi:alkaline phosphatase D